MIDQAAKATRQRERYWADPEKARARCRKTQTNVRRRRGAPIAIRYPSKQAKLAAARERYNAEIKRKYYKDNKLKIREQYHAPENRCARLIKGAAARAKKQNLSYDLTIEWAQVRWTGHCELSGIEFHMNGTATQKQFSPSIDRIDPSKGYTRDNCRFVLWAINLMKGDGDDDTLYRIINAVSAFADSADD